MAFTNFCHPLIGSRVMSLLGLRSSSADHAPSRSGGCSAVCVGVECCVQVPFQMYSILGRRAILRIADHGRHMEKHRSCSYEQTTVSEARGASSQDEIARCDSADHSAAILFVRSLGQGGSRAQGFPSSTRRDSQGDPTTTTWFSKILPGLYGY